jgi:hypothetical protein
MSAALGSYYLSWKGRQSGPFTLEQVRKQLASGEISRMHQIGVNGGWQLLDEFLTQHPDEKAAQRVTELQQQEARLRQEYETQLATERASRNSAEQAAQNAEERASLAHLVPREPAPRTQTYVPHMPAPPLPSPFPSDHRPTRTSGLAIAALVLALCCFIPYINFFSWILALAFGHTALGQIKRDPDLDGRGMALAALIITYFLLIMGATFIALILYHGLKFSNYLPL